MAFSISHFSKSRLWPCRARPLQPVPARCAGRNWSLVELLLVIDDALSNSFGKIVGAPGPADLFLEDRDGALLLPLLEHAVEAIEISNFAGEILSGSMRQRYGRSVRGAVIVRASLHDGGDHVLSALPCTRRRTGAFAVRCVDQVATGVVTFIERRALRLRGPWQPGSPTSPDQLSSMRRP